MSQEAVDYIITAVAMTAKHGWKLLPQVTMVVHMLCKWCSHVFTCCSSDVHMLFKWCSTLLYSIFLTRRQGYSVTMVTTHPGSGNG
jgi:hypothetical protein